MDTAGFLARIVPASGNYLSIVYKLKGGGWGTRSFPPAQVREAVHLSEWHAKNGNDVYFALAAFNAGEPKTDKRGQAYVVAPREQKNVQYLRCLVMDADVKRAGDKKDPSTCFASKADVGTWLRQFCQAINLALPSAMVDSGYGLHFYWILDEELRLSEWQPLADALKAAMLANGWVGDTSPTVDSARILRVPGTQNFKSGQGVPVYLRALADYNYSKASITEVLQPFVGMVQAKTGTGGTANLGQRPKHLPSGRGLHENAAGWANTERQYSMAAIAQRCLQVKTSLANQGNGDPYPLWYRDNLSLCAFTIDGVDYVHEFSKGDPRYSEADTDARWARIQQERDTKGLGAPTCASFDADRRGVCPDCPWYKKITSPISLGVEDGDGDLPLHYRRNKTDGTIEHEVMTKDGPKWVRVVAGDVYRPSLEPAQAGYRISFIYALGAKELPVVLDAVELNVSESFKALVSQGIQVDAKSHTAFANFVMAWIEKLRLQREERGYSVTPFGWQHDQEGILVGGSVAGELYRPDGSIEMVPGGDPGIVALYKSMGTFDNWRKAAALFEGYHPELQMIIATSFAGPLVGLAGDVHGVSLNFWGPSGLGKTSAAHVGITVWGHPKAKSKMTDTSNSAIRALSQPRFLTRFWDDMQDDDRDAPARIRQLIFQMSQGLEKSRMRSDTTQRDIGDWETLMVLLANRSFADHLDVGTDAGLLRLLEVMVNRQVAPLNAAASQALKLLETNYGHAGRIYLRYLVENIEAVKADLAKTQNTLSSVLNVQREERFYLTAATTIIQGAIIAKRLGLFAFDVRAIAKVLETAIGKARGLISGNTLVMANGRLDAEQLVSDYLVDVGDCILRTDDLSGGRAIFPRMGKLRVHIIRNPAIMQLGQHEFFEWLRHRRRLPTAPVLEDLINTHQAKQRRVTLGLGTHQAIHRKPLIEIPLTGSFAGVLDDGYTPPKSRGGAPGAALAGNQPTV